MTENDLQQTIDFWEAWLNEDKSAVIGEFMMYGSRSLEVCKQMQKHLKEKQERDNLQPLTLDELQQMDGQPVWVNRIGYGVIDTHRHSEINIAIVIMDGWYVAKDVLENGIYSHKPKEVQP